MITVVILDIDGVVTDGKLYITEDCQEIKKIDYRDIDAIFALKRMGYSLAFITGEDSRIVDYFENRFPNNHFYRGCKDKVSAIKTIIQKEKVTPNEVCFIGDSMKDIDGISYVGLGACPNNACQEVKAAAKVVLKSNGGDGVIQELLMFLEQNKSIHGQQFL